MSITGKKVAVYVRVSTDKQELLNQLIQLKEYCLKSNYEIWGEFEDITSGKDDSRPGFDSMFLQAHRKQFDIVLFWSLDRFSRSGTLFTLQKLRELENLGIGWHSYTEQYFSSVGPFKDVVISIMATIAKLERERISERTKAGINKPGVREKVGKRGPDDKPRRRRSDRGIKRGMPKDPVVEYMRKRELKRDVFNDAQ
jgi:DNA invertase Pin-like site-specific DNA recombinase